MIWMLKCIYPYLYYISWQIETIIMQKMQYSPVYNSRQWTFTPTLSYAYPRFLNLTQGGGNPIQGVGEFTYPCYFLNQWSKRLKTWHVSRLPWEMFDFIKKIAILWWRHQFFVMTSSKSAFSKYFRDGHRSSDCNFCPKKMADP